MCRFVRVMNSRANSMSASMRELVRATTAIVKQMELTILLTNNTSNEGHVRKLVSFTIYIVSCAPKKA